MSMGGEQRDSVTVRLAIWDQHVGEGDVATKDFDRGQLRTDENVRSELREWMAGQVEAIMINLGLDK